MADHNDLYRPRTTTPVRDAIVIGAGPTGLSTALLLPRAGHSVLVLDRDPASPGRTAHLVRQDWSRPGVNQFVSCTWRCLVGTD